MCDFVEYTDTPTWLYKQRIENIVMSIKMQILKYIYKHI